MPGDSALIAIAGDDDALLRILINLVNDAGRLDPDTNNARAVYSSAIERLGMPGAEFYRFLQRCQNGVRTMIMLKSLATGYVTPEDIRAWIPGEKGIDVAGLLTRIRVVSPDFASNENAQDY